MKSLLQRFYMIYDYPFRYATMNLAIGLKYTIFGKAWRVVVALEGSLYANH